MTIQYQQQHVLLNVNIQGENFTLRTLIDLCANINVLIKKVIPAKYRTFAYRQVTGIGIQDFQYEVSTATLCFSKYCMKMKFAVGNIPVHCILGNIFLVAIEPHGSTRLQDDNAGYFIFVPDNKGFLQTVTLPFISTPRISTIVQTM